MSLLSKILSMMTSPPVPDPTQWGEVPGATTNNVPPVAEPSSATTTNGKKTRMGKMRLNGVEYEVSDGASVSVLNGKVTINGVDVATLPQPGTVIINITGSVGDVKSDGPVNVTGNSGRIDGAGSVVVGGVVNGNVDSGGSCVATDVSGSVRAGGSVKCGNVGGSISASGSVTHL